MSLDDSLSAVKGIGPKKAALFNKLGITNLRQLLYYMPRGYETQGENVKISFLHDDGTFNITALISKEPVLRRIRKGLSLVTFSLQDETGSAEAVFFNQPYISKFYKKGDTVYVSGKIKRVGRMMQFANPVMEKEGPRSQGMLPLYNLTAGLTQKSMRMIIQSALQKYSGFINEIFPNEFRKRYSLAEANFAVMNIHFPKDEASLELAKKRLIFEELLLFNIALISCETESKGNAKIIPSCAQTRDAFFEMMGFQPTNAQLRVIGEIEDDLSKSKPMYRLLQGDVGSGKTMPAFYAMYLCAKSGFQSVLMAPTEVLARQHYHNAQRVFKNTSLNIELITGSTTKSVKETVYENAAGGMTDIVIGTHALINDALELPRLGLVITDEQHRFGVSQRAMLENKSISPHILIMSATPIPRTLALILYGKTDMSIIDEMPPGRLPVKTFCVPEHKRENMYGFIQQEISSGAQVFVICPAVEQNEETDMISSEEVYERLSKRFKRVALLHGRMKSTDKNETMLAFRNKEYDILVSTTVIEVGVDIPAATVMVIENAERFGLAQLHQLRGRVGRGSRKSYCFLMGSENNERLKILTETNDGYKIAEHDLMLRGPGQYLGNKQSGVSDLYMANLIKDMKLLHLTRHVAEDLYIHDRELYANFRFHADNRFNFKLTTG